MDFQDSTELEYAKIMRKKILIIGDLGSGKTALTSKLLDQAMKICDNAILDNVIRNNITVIDFAPGEIIRLDKKVGGKLSDPTLTQRTVGYLSPEKVNTPRISGKTSLEVEKLAKENASMMEKILKEYLEKPTPILFINDVSLFLQAGDYDILKDVLNNSETAVINGYYGEELSEDRGSGVTERERQLMNKLIDDVDIVIKL